MTRLRLALLSVLMLAPGGAVAWAQKIEPSSHDFGELVTRGGARETWFTISVAKGGTGGLAAAIVGPDAGDFSLGTANGCATAAASCTLAVIFKPRSIGAKVATLRIDDGKGSPMQASLRGTGIAPECTNDVVFCNYAFLYSGKFSWTTASEVVNVTIVDGVATCNGSAGYVGRPKGVVNGTGLVAVEFVRGSVTDSTGNEGPERLVYRVTVACPSPAVPATADAAATPSRPAEMGDFFQQTYNQPATKAAMSELVGSTSTPVEGEGVVSVIWSLKRK